MHRNIGKFRCAKVSDADTRCDAMMRCDARPGVLCDHQVRLLPSVPGQPPPPLAILRLALCDTWHTSLEPPVHAGQRCAGHVIGQS
eukprot:124423-Rhodomonas_salina.3